LARSGRNEDAECVEKLLGDVYDVLSRPRILNRLLEVASQEERGQERFLGDHVSFELAAWLHAVVAEIRARGIEERSIEEIRANLLEEEKSRRMQSSGVQNKREYDEIFTFLKRLSDGLFVEVTINGTPAIASRFGEESMSSLDLWRKFSSRFPSEEIPHNNRALFEHDEMLRFALEECGLIPDMALPEALVMEMLLLVQQKMGDGVLREIIENNLRVKTPVAALALEIVDPVLPDGEEIKIPASQISTQFRARKEVFKRYFGKTDDPEVFVLLPRSLEELREIQGWDTLGNQRRKELEELLVQGIVDLYFGHILKIIHHDDDKAVYGAASQRIRNFHS